MTDKCWQSLAPSLTSCWWNHKSLRWTDQPAGMEIHLR